MSHTIKIICKPYEFEAFQITEEKRADNSSWPNWLNEAWQLDRKEIGSVFSEDYPNSDGTDRIVVNTHKGAKIINWGDYIIRNQLGALHPLDKDSFDEEFIEVNNLVNYVNVDDPQQMLKSVNRLVGMLELKGQVSDGYHTFDELYEHRYALFIALVNTLFCRDIANAYIAEANADGTKWPGWFLVVLETSSGQISYHLPERLRSELSPDLPVYDVNPYYDGHTSQDVVNRLIKLDV